MTMQFTGKPIWWLRVTLHRPNTKTLGGEELKLTKPADQTDQDFLSAVAEFHSLVMAQDMQFFTIGGHCIKPYFVERIELMVTYVDPDEKRF